MRAICFLVLVTLAIGATGCQTTVESPARRTTRVEGAQSTEPGNFPVSPEHAVQSDPCAARMHNIAGAMLLYYAVNKHLPPTLDDLSAMVDADMVLELTCPDTKGPYVYVPAGLRNPNRPKMIILHDPMKVNGKRWCILINPSGPGAAQSLEVLDLPEPLFLAYQGPQ